MLLGHLQWSPFWMEILWFNGDFVRYAGIEHDLFILWSFSYRSHGKLSSMIYHYQKVWGYEIRQSYDANYQSGVNVSSIRVIIPTCVEYQHCLKPIPRVWHLPHGSTSKLSDWTRSTDLCGNRCRNGVIPHRSRAEICCFYMFFTK